MKVFEAIGMGLAIMILKWLVPELVSGFVGTLTALFGVTQTVLANVQFALGPQ